MARKTVSIVCDVVDDVPPADVVLLEAHLDASNIASTGIDDARILAIMLRRADGELYAGLYGHSWGGTCQIKLLWITERERGRGLGTTLLKAAEDEARQRGCHQIMLSTHSFQAPEFYTKHAFVPLATVDNNPIGHSDILMLKLLI